MTWTPQGKRGTGSARWRRTRTAVLARDNHQCQIAGPHCVGEATDADHIVPEAEGGTDDLDNLQAACLPCHKDKTRADAARGRRRRAARGRHPGEPHPGLR